MMLIPGLQDPQVYALGSLWFLVLRLSWDLMKFGRPGRRRLPEKISWFRNGPGLAQKRVREEPQKAQKRSGRSPKRLRNGPGGGALVGVLWRGSGGAQKSAEMVRGALRNCLG